MTYTSLDSIVRNVLQRKGYPIHWYFQTLINARNILRELHFDVLRCVNSVTLVVGTDNTITLPDDYVDYTKVGIRNGNHIRPLIQSDSLIAAEPQKVANTDAATSIYYGFPATFGISWGTMLTDSYGEVTGRMYGYGAGPQLDTFRVLREQGKILLNNAFLPGTNIILEYIGNANGCDSATQVDPYAQACIEAYCMWQFAEQNRTSSLGEKQFLKQQYEHQLAILRHRKNDITIADIKRIMQKHHVLSIK